MDRYSLLNNWMKNLTIVTTFTEELWNSYACRSIPSWFNFLQGFVNFHFHTDNFLPLQNKNIRCFADSDAKKNFLKRNHDLNRNPPKDIPGVGRRWWQYCHKVFAQYESSLEVENGYMIFLDADVAVLEKFSSNEVENFLNGKFCGYVGRDTLLTETGLIIYDLDHPGSREFLYDFYNLYNNDKLFDLHSWCDCSAFDYARKNSKLPFINLSGEYSKYVDPISVGPLGRYFDHWMGKLSKRRGYSKHRKMRGRV